MIKEFSHYRPENVKMWPASSSYKTEAARLYGVEIIVGLTQGNPLRFLKGQCHEIFYLQFFLLVNIFQAS